MVNQRFSLHSQLLKNPSYVVFHLLLICLSSESRRINATHPKEIVAQSERRIRCKRRHAEQPLMNQHRGRLGKRLHRDIG